jgi:hypothetical protein
MALCLVLELISTIVLVLVVIVLAFNVPGATPHATAEAFAKSGSFKLVESVIDKLSTVVGGYAVARLASRHPYLNASVFGAIGIGLHGLAVAFFSDQAFSWNRGAYFVLTIPAALLGAYLAKPHSDDLDRDLDSTT